MHVTSLRYRYTTQETWNFLRFPTGTGDLKNLQIIEADSKALEPILEAFRFVLHGQLPSQPTEAVLQIHDDDGAAWSILRKAGSLRITRDGEMVDSQMAYLHLLQGIGITSLQQIDFEKDKLKLLNPQNLVFESNRLELWPLGEGEPSPLVLGRYLREKIQHHLDLIQKSLDSVSPIALSQTIKIHDSLEPIYTRYMDIEHRCVQWSSEQKQTSKDFINSSLHENQQNTHKFAKELSIMAEIQKIVSPLSGPQAPSLAALEKQKKILVAQLEATEKVIGPLEDINGEVPDFNQAFDVLCRLHAYGKLVKSTQSLRDYCESNIEPQVKSYLSQSETLGTHLRSLLEGLQADQHKIQLQREILVPKSQGDTTGRESATAGKTWFDRFKAPHKTTANGTGALTHGRELQNDTLSDHVQKLTSTVENIIIKGASILAELPNQENHHENLKQAFDFSIDQLVQKFSKVRQEWQALAKSLRLPESLDIINLIKYVILFERSMVLRERLDFINSQIVDFQDKILRLEKLIIQWRKVTESQKQNPLDQPHLVIQEALSITRYLESKIKRFDQVLDQFADHNIKGQVLEMISAQFSSEKAQLLKTWTEEAAKINLPNLLITSSSVPDVLKNALKIKQYWQILQETTITASKKPQTTSLVEIWSLTQDHLDIKLLVDHLGTSNIFASIILVCPHQALNTKLAALGASVGTLTARQVQTPSTVLPPQPLVPTMKPTPTLKKQVVGPQNFPSAAQSSGPKTPSAETLQARAERVLAMLGPKDQPAKRSS